MLKLSFIKNVIKIIRAQIFRHQLCRYIELTKPNTNATDLFVCKNNNCVFTSSGLSES